MHFALVHGAYHGAWCWDLLRPELERRGHSTSAVDLPIEDPDAGAERYADEVVNGIPRSAGDVVLVGHSMAGLIIPLIAARLKVRSTVYLAAILPVPGLSFDAQHADIDTGFHVSQPAVSHVDGSASWPAQGAIEMYFHDCKPDVAAWAASQLRRQHWRVTQEVTPVREWPKVSAGYILCKDDRAIAPAYSREAAREVLGLEAIELPGGHSPFLARPEELAATLGDAAGAQFA